MSVATTEKNQPNQLIERIRAEYLEMPVVRLTAIQVQRLCGVDAGTCAAVIDALVTSRFLSANADGTYVRHTPDSIRSRTLRAQLRLPAVAFRSPVERML
jgi:hypothetical protein